MRIRLFVFYDSVPEYIKTRGLARFPKCPRAFPFAGPAKRLGFAGPRVLSVC